jgi:hypothetical protein
LPEKAKTTPFDWYFATIGSEGSSPAACCGEAERTQKSERRKPGRSTMMKPLYVPVYD